jgi:phosphate starvation-inducible PhoH-like protein
MSAEKKRLTRREKRIARQEEERVESHQSIPKPKLALQRINPLTYNQQKTFEEYRKGQHLLLHGTAGTGKTFISLYLALKDLLETNLYENIIVVRSIVPTRDIGFLPGNQKEKSKAYESPYYAIFSELFNRGDAYDIFRNKRVINFVPTSFIRGVTIRDSIIIADEVQNFTFHECDSVITRMGDNCRILFCGDFRQSDLIKSSDRDGIHDFMHILRTMHSFSTIEFTQDDIVRSGIVKEYIVTKEELNYD